MKMLFIIFTMTIGYICFLILSRSKRIYHLVERNMNDFQFGITWILFQRIVGALCFGSVYFIFRTTRLYRDMPVINFFKPFDSRALLWTLGLGCMIILFSAIVFRRPRYFSKLPQIRVKEWRISTIILNIVTWSVYLFAYEIMFRGVLLFSLQVEFGSIPAVLISTALYSLAHIPKGKAETAGAVPFGIVLAMITLETETIWTAFLLHGILALSSDHFALSASPEMRYRLTRY